MIDDTHLDDLTQEKEKKLKELEQCYIELSSHKKNKLILEYPTFFVPGWTGENSATWLQPYEIKKSNKFYEPKYSKFYRPIFDWINEIVENSKDAHPVMFTEEETSKSLDFIALGKYLKRKIFEIVKNAPINLVGHSMGGLDIRAAILDDDKYTLNVKTVITLGTPHNGTAEAGLLYLPTFKRLVKKMAGWPSHHIAQGYSMFYKSIFIQQINTTDNRLKFLNSVSKFYDFMGLEDLVVKDSPKLNLEGIGDSMRSKVETFQVAMAKHSGEAEITKDPRVILPILKILSGIELKNSYNKGVFEKGYVMPR